MMMVLEREEVMDTFHESSADKHRCDADDPAAFVHRLPGKVIRDEEAHAAGKCRKVRKVSLHPRADATRGEDDPNERNQHDGERCEEGIPDFYHSGIIHTCFLIASDLHV